MVKYYHISVNVILNGLNNALHDLLAYYLIVLFSLQFVVVIPPVRSLQLLPVSRRKLTVLWERPEGIHNVKLTYKVILRDHLGKCQGNMEVHYQTCFQQFKMNASDTCLIPFNSNEWPRQNFSLQHKHNIIWSRKVKGDSRGTSIRRFLVDPISNPPN